MISTNDHQQHLREQAALYWLGQLPPDEARRVEQSGSPVLAEMSEFLASAAIHSLEPLAEPPRALKNRLMTRIATTQTPHPGLFSKRAHEQGPWKASKTAAGISYKKLYADPSTGLVTMLVKMEPGARLDSHTHKRTEQCLILEGDLRYSDEKVYRTGDFTWAEAGTTDPALYTVEGNVLLIIGEP